MEKNLLVYTTSKSRDHQCFPTVRDTDAHHPCTPMGMGHRSSWAPADAGVHENLCLLQMNE